MPGGIVPPGFQGEFSSAPGTPASPQDILSTRVPPAPSIFSVQFSPDGTNFVFTVGYAGLGYVTTGRYIAASFLIWFMPIAAANSIDLVNTLNANTSYKNAVLVQTISIPPNSNSVSFSTNAYLNRDGWFWATAISTNGAVSPPTRAYRSPAGLNLINLSIPPNCSSPAVSKTSPTVEGIVYSLVKASAVVPSNNSGVISVVMNALGTGYKNDASTTVTFTGGLAAGGTAATGTPIVNPNGTITGVVLTASGSGYVSPPAVVFAGAGSNAAATAYLGQSTAFDGFQLYLTNYLGNATRVEGPYVTASGAVPGATIFGSFYMIPDGAHTTTFTFVAVSRAGVRSLSGAPTATLIV